MARFIPQARSLVLIVEVIGIMSKRFFSLAALVVFASVLVGCSADTVFDSGYIVDVTCYSGGDVVIAEQSLYVPLSVRYFKLENGQVGNRVEYSEENCVFSYGDIVSISRDGGRWEIDHGR